MRPPTRFFKNGALAGGVVLLCGLAAAQTQETLSEKSTAVPTAVSGQAEPAAAQEAPAGPITASSIEQGQAALDESFDWGKRVELIRAQRQAALSNTEFKVELRTMYLDRNNYNGSENEAWAAGLSAGMKTGYFLDRIALGWTLYTSQPVDDPPDSKDGTLLLKPGQEGYTVLGELYGDIRLADNVHAYAGRKAFDTPYINRNDVRMTPNTFEAAVLQGKVNLGADTNSKSSFNYGFGYFDSIKERNDDEFVSMSEDAGSSVDRGVYAAGGNYKNGDFSLGAIDYVCENVLHIAYTEAKCAIPLPLDLKLKLSAQYSYQDNDMAGDTADQVGVKAEVPVGRATFTVAGTDTGSGADMTSPWGGYPGYTSVQVEDFNRAGEAALLLRAAYEFSSIKGLSAYALWVNGTEPDAPGQYARDEYNMNLQWKAGDGILKGLTLRARYAYITQDEDAGATDDEDREDLRLIVYYDLATWLSGIKL